MYYSCLSLSYWCNYNIINRWKFKYIFCPARRGTKYQHIFWCFGHPEVIILIIPGYSGRSDLIFCWNLWKLNMTYARTHTRIRASEMMFLITFSCVSRRYLLKKVDINNFLRTYSLFKTNKQYWQGCKEYLQRTHDDQLWKQVIFSSKEQKFQASCLPRKLRNIGRETKSLCLHNTVNSQKTIRSKAWRDWTL